MTLIVVIPASDGIAMGSDSQITSGMVRTIGPKIRQLNDRCIWGASGELALIQRVAEILEALPDKNQYLFNLRDKAAELIKMHVETLLRLDFRTQFFHNDPNTLLSLHPGDFVFAEYGDEARVLHILSNGTPEWIQWPFASGGGELFAYALLQKYQRKTLDVDRAMLLTFKVIEEAIEVGAYGLGPPIDIWKITAHGVKQLPESEIAALEDACRALREIEVSLLIRPVEGAQT
jgi:proteasome beta subunit